MAGKIRARHILVKTENDALELSYDIKNGKKTFEQAAMEKSLCPSCRKGGDLGWFGRGQMIREFEHAAFSLQPGEISKPVKTQFGWHLIKIEEKS